jgi:hypothetical protein
MAIKAVVLDLDGTLIGPDGRPVAGVPELLVELARAGLRTAVASNQPGAPRRLAAAGIAPDLVLDHASVGSNKGTKAWVGKACADFGVAPHELVWLGDGDLDMREAVNSKVAYFNAGWSRPAYRYGINLLEPRLFGAVVRECFAKPVDWFVAHAGADPAGRPATVYAMTDSRGGGDPNLEAALRRFLKERVDFPLGPFRFGEVVTLHLLGSIYGAGLAQATDTWTVYPGSKTTSGTNASLAPFVANAARLFHNSYVDDLLVRHADAPDSGQTRAAGGQVGFGNQINTLHLNPLRRQRVAGKRVVVVDDFETNGNSLECARNLLLQAGAARVTCVSIGKYRMRGRGLARAVWAPVAGYAWDPFAPTTHVAANFREGIVGLAGDEDAPAHFRDSCRRFARL